MEKNELIKKYELMIIIDAKLSNEEKELILKTVVEAVNKNGGKVINSRVWLEKHKLTFSVQRCQEGTYYLINFESETPAVNTIHSNLRLNEKILRFVIIRVEAHQFLEPVRS